MPIVLPVASGILSSLFPYSDEVAIYTDDNRQVFQNARPVKVSVKPDSKLMEHPLETGASVSDHRVILPIEIEISYILSGMYLKDTYQTITNYYKNATLLTVQTRCSTYKRMVIGSIPHEESPDNYNVALLSITLKEANFVQTSVSEVSPDRKPIVPKNPSDDSTTDRGQQEPKKTAAKEFVDGIVKKFRSGS